MTREDIKKFEIDIADISNEKVNPFVQIYSMLKGMIVADWKAIPQVFMDELSQECKDIERLQAFLADYIEFQSKLMLEFEVLETLEDNKFHKKIESIADNIFSTVPDFVKQQNLFGAIEDIVVTIIEEYSINMKITNHQQLEQNINKAFNNNEMMAKVFKEFLGTHANYIQNQEEEYSIDRLIEFHRMLIIFVFVANLHRRQQLDAVSSLSNSSLTTANNIDYLKVGRNEPCPCGSGKKYKKCCLDKKPPIWRRILVESDSSFGDLHFIIQRIFNWENDHMYEFTGKNGHYSDDEFIQEPYGRGGLRNYSSYDYVISDELQNEKDKISYTYDFGDNCKHNITLEKILEVDTNTKYPICIAGRRNGPLEDCGGMWDYEDIVYAIKNKDYSDVGHFFDDEGDFYYSDFDPDLFDIEAINKRL